MAAWSAQRRKDAGAMLNGTFNTLGYPMIPSANGDNNYAKDQSRLPTGDPALKITMAGMYGRGQQQPVPMFTPPGASLGGETAIAAIDQQAPVIQAPVSLGYNGSTGASLSTTAKTSAPRFYRSGGYIFAPNGKGGYVNIGRDAQGVVSQTYHGTPEAAAKAAARDRLTADRSGASYADSQSRFETTAISRANAAR
jgi:hypothetical protein